MKKKQQRVPAANRIARAAPEPLWALPWVHLIALGALCLAIYGSALNNGFVSDDNFQLLNNPLVKDWRRIPAIFGHSVWALAGAPKTNYYRPLQLISYMAVHALFGFDPRVYHLVMLILHAAATMLVYLLARELIVRWPPATGAAQTTVKQPASAIRDSQAAGLAAVVGAAVFAVHPIHSEAVVWVAALPDVLVAVFVLAGLYAFLRAGVRPGLAQALGIAALYFAALLTKETGATLLPLIVGCEVLVAGRRPRGLLFDWRLYTLLAGVAGTYAALRLHVLGSFAPAQGAYIHLTRPQIMFSTVFLAAKYLGKLVLPSDLNYYHVFDPVSGPSVLWVVALVACAGVLAGIAVLAVRGRAGATAAFLLFFIAITLAPVLNITGVGPNPFAERYLYLPSAGFALLAALAWQWALPRVPSGARKAAWTGLALLLVAASAEVMARTPDWRDDVTLFTRTIQQSPRAALVRGNLGWWHLQRGELDAAEADYRTALATDPGSALLHNSLGTVLGTKKQYPEAIREMRRAIEIDPSYADAHFNLGLALEGSGDTHGALAGYREAIALQPNHPRALTAMGLLFSSQGNLNAAIDCYRRAIFANDEYPEAHMNLGLALSSMGMYAEAVQELHRALEIAPAHPQAHVVHYGLGVAYQQQGLNDIAEAEFAQAVQLQPGFDGARQKLDALRSARQQSRPASPLKLF